MDKTNVIPYGFDRDEEVISLLNRVFNPWGGDHEYFIWKYRKLNLEGCDFPRAWIIEKEGKIVAFNGYMPRLIQLGNFQFWAVQSFDTATDPDCRGGGLFGILQNSVYEEMKKHNIAWVYGWTSEIGYKVFTKKTGWKLWAHQRYLMKVLNVKNFVRQKIKNPFLQIIPHLILSGFTNFMRPQISEFTVRKEKILPESADLMCQKICRRFGMIAIRDVPYIRWRFSNPNNLSRLICVYSKEVPCGYAVLTERDNNLEIDDCLADSYPALRSLLAEIENIARKDKNDLILFRVNENYPWSHIFYRSGYFQSNTSFRMLGHTLTEQDLSFDVKNLHWTFFDKNE